MKNLLDEEVEKFKELFEYKHLYTFSHKDENELHIFKIDKERYYVQIRTNDNTTLHTPTGQTISLRRQPNPFIQAIKEICKLKQLSFEYEITNEYNKK